MESLRLQIEASLGRSRDMLVEDHYRRMHFEGTRHPPGHPSPHRMPIHLSPVHHRMVPVQQHHHPAMAISSHPLTQVNVQGSPTNPSTAGGKLKKQLHLLAKRTIGKKQGSSTKGPKYPDEVSPIYYRHPRDKYGSVSALSTSAIYGELRPPPPSYAALYGGSTGARQASNRRGSAAALGGVHVTAPRRVGRVSVSPWETFLNIGEPIYEDVAQEMSSALSSPPETPTSIPCTCPPRPGGSLRVTSSSSISGSGSISPRRKSILPEKIELYALTEERLDGELKSPPSATSSNQKTDSPARRHSPKHSPPNNKQTSGSSSNNNNNNNNKHVRHHSESSNKINVGNRRITSPPGMSTGTRKKLEANKFSSVASRKSILECDLTAYDMVKQYIKTAEMDSDADEDDLSDNIVEELAEKNKKLAPRWSEERRSTGSESDPGIGGSETSIGGRPHSHGGNRKMAATTRTAPVAPLGIDSDDGFVSVPEPDYDDDEEDSDASYDLSKFKDLRISYSPPPARKPNVVVPASSNPSTSPPSRFSNSASSVSSLSSAYSSPPQSSSGSSSHYQGSLYSSNSTYGATSASVNSGGRTFSSSPSRFATPLTFNQPPQMHNNSSNSNSYQNHPAPPPLPPPMPTNSAGINRVSHSPTRPLAVPIPSVPRVNTNHALSPPDKSNLSPKRTLERPTIPPPPPPPPPLPSSATKVASPYAVSEITPPPLPPRSPTTKITPMPMSTFAPLPTVSPPTTSPPPIPTTTTTTDVPSPVATSGLANLTVRSILKKTPSSQSTSGSGNGSGGSTSGSSKQVRFGVGQNDEALVIEHIEDNRWDSEEEVAAEDAVIPESESDDGPSQATNLSSGSSSRTDPQMIGEEFQSVETYLKCPSSLRSSWTIRNPNSNANSDNSTTNTTSGGGASATTGSSSNKPEERTSGIEFKEFDPAAAESTATPTTTAQKNGQPSPAVPRPIDLESSTSGVSQSVENIQRDELAVRHFDENAAKGQRGKVESFPIPDHQQQQQYEDLRNGGKCNDVITTTTTTTTKPKDDNNQGQTKRTEVSKQGHVEERVLKLSSSTFYVNVDENQSSDSTAKTEETIQPEPATEEVSNPRSSPTLPGLSSETEPENRLANQQRTNNPETEVKEVNGAAAAASVSDKESEMYAEVNLPDIEVTQVDIYDDARSGEPIYEELPDNVVVEEKKHKSLSDFIMSNDFSPCDGQPRSFFEGASRAEILHYLEDAKERGIILSEDFITEINEMEEEAKRERDENNRNNRISTLSHSSTGSSANSGNDDDIDDEDLEDSGHHNGETSEFILKPFTGIVTNGVVIDHVNKEQDAISEKDNHQVVTNGHSASSAEVERADSGVGTETSKPSVRLRRFVAKKPPGADGQDGAPEDELLCADCDQPVEPVEDELSGQLFCPLVCKKCDRRRAERKEIISEIVETELKYGRDLRIIKEEFQRPMEVAGLLTKEHLKAIFLNLDELVRVNGQFAEKLHDATDIATEQGDEDYTTVNIGKLFLESTTMLHAFETYCVRQASASLLLTNLEKEKELLRIFLRVSQMENTLLRRMNLPAFLMVPVQRVTKYPLLLSRLHKVTPYHHQDREALREAQQKIELHLEHINQQTKGSGATRIWRRISNISSSNHRRLSNVVDDISSIKLRKMALEILKWNRDEVRFVLAGRLLCATVVGSHRNSLQMGESGLSSPSSPAGDGSASGPNGTHNGTNTSTEARLQGNKKVKPLKLTPLHGLLVTLGKPNANYRPETADDEDGVFFPRNTGIRDATLLLIREKNGRLVQFRGPLHLGSCVISCWEGEKDSFEIQEFHTKEAYVFKCEDSKESRDWCHQLRYHAKDLGRWRRRRNALANIMINGMVRH